MKTNKVDRYSEVNNLLLWVGSLFLFSLFLIVWVPSYLGLTPSSDLVLITVSDGGCELKTQGIGLHCFGDYYLPLSFAGSANPWDIEGAAPYPASSLVILAAFNELTIALNNEAVGLYSFLLSSPLIMLLILIKSYRQFKFPFLYVVVLLSFVVASSPFLFAFDRGNLILLALPLTIFLLSSFIKKNYTVFLFILILMTFIKIQFILFLLILLTSREILKFLIYGFVTIIANLIPFLFFDKDIAHNINAFLKTLLSYQEYAQPGVLSFNISLPNSIAILDRLILNNSASDTSYPSTIISMFCLVLMCLFLWTKGNQLNPMHSFLLIILFLILAPNVSFAYYLILFLGYLIYAILDHIENISKEKSESLGARFLHYFSKRNRVLILTSYILLFIPWSVPWLAILPEVTPLYTWESSTSITRFPGQLVLVLLFISLLITWLPKVANKSNFES
jgi:hypothetical protein